MKDFARHAAEWRDPSQIVAQWQGARRGDPALLEATTRGRWWETLEQLQITLLVTRETEHLVIALRADGDGPDTSYLRLPHPSGLVADRTSGTVHVASTRNPNQVFDLEPARSGIFGRKGQRIRVTEPVLVPTRSRFFPGSMYLHDLALIGGRLHGNAVGQNAIVSLADDGPGRYVWWPRSIEANGRPAFHANYLQLNSIAAGVDLERSFFSASAATVSSRRPGHINFPVDGRGVIFSGATREPAVTGLTRPHSARMFDDVLWVDNSGYGTVGSCPGGTFDIAATLPGWTRGLCFAGSIAFVGTSRVIPRYQHYAPGLDIRSSVCGVHAIDTADGVVLGSISWPAGNQIFAIDWVDAPTAKGLPFRTRDRGPHAQRELFYSFATARESFDPTTATGDPPQ